MMKHNLSNADRMVLKEILSKEDKKTSDFISKKLGIPSATVQRKRKLLEKEFLKEEVFFPLHRFGWRHVDFFVSTTNGKTDEVAKHLLALDPIIYVGKSIGQHTIDLRVETIVNDNSQIVDVMEKIKAMEGTRDVVWSEIVSSVGRKSSIPSFVIDLL